VSQAGKRYAEEEKRNIIENPTGKIGEAGEQLLALR
jgi:hypothetical protein